MFQKKVCYSFVSTVMVLCLTWGLQAGQISSAGYTNNIANFDGYTNVIDGGRWSYLDEAYAPYTSNGVMGTQFTPGVDWAAAAPSVSAWRVQNNGAIFTDNRGIAFNYTFDAADANTGWARITGTYGGPGGHRLIINKVADSSLTTIDSGQTVTLLDQSSESVITFDITIPIAAGNDITFIGVDNLYWWEPYTLDATITPTPSLLAPAANEKVSWKHPRKYTIKWPSSGGNNYVNIKFSSGSLLDWQVIATYVPDTGSYLWTVPSLESSNCMLWVYDSNSGAPVAISSTPFEIYECLVNDITGNCFVNFADFAVLASQWLQCGNAFDSNWCDQYRWFGPTFKEFSGTVQSDATPDVTSSADDLWKSGALSWGRWDILWSNCEPNQGQWNQQYLVDRVSAIWPDHIALNTQVLPLLFAGTSWSGDGTVTISSSHIVDWQNYVYKVVDYLRRPPYNVEYFQIWNEPSAGTGDWWDGTMDQFMTNCYLPAAEVIHNLGCKVVYGGWPDGVSLATYVSLMDSYDAWVVTDVHDMHYLPLSSWQYLYDAMASRGYANRPIWQTEVGFTDNPSSVSMMYPRFLYWGLTHNWSYKDKYKLFWFAQWSPDDTGAFGYQKTLYSGSSLWTHGKSMQTLSTILKSSKLTAYTNVQNNLGLSFAQDLSSSGIETIATDDAKVIVVHLNATDYAAHSQIVLTLPEYSIAGVSSIERVDISGYSTSLTGSAYDVSGQLTIPVPTADDGGSPVVTSWGLSGAIHTFYIKVK